MTSDLLPQVTDVRGLVRTPQELQPVADAAAETYSGAALGPWVHSPLLLAHRSS